MNKLFFIIFCTTFLISLCSALNFGISPDKIILSGKVNEVSCKNFSIFGNNSDLFEGKVLWSRINSRILSDYDLTYESKINATFPNLTNPGNYQICISSKDSGTYYGVLMYKLRNSSYGIGTWIELKIANDSPNQKISLLTGSSIQNINPIKISLIISPIIFAIILTVLLIKLKKKSSRINLNI